MLSKLKSRLSENETIINKTITLLSCIVLLSCFVYMCYQSIETIAWSFRVNSYLNEEILKENGEIFSIHSSILISAIMLLYLSIFKRTIKIYMVAGILLFNIILPTYHFMEFVVPHYLDYLGIYNWRKSEGQLMFNPQWTNVYLLIIGLIILFIQVCLKKTRSFDRIFAFVISLSITLTLILFHSVVVFGYYKFQREYQVSLLERQILHESKDEFCKNRMCFDIYYKQDGKSFDIVNTNKFTKVNNQYFDKYFPFVLFTLQMYKLNINEVKASHLQNPETVGFDYFTFGVKKVDKNNAIFVLDNQNRKFSEINIVFFSLLTAVAHTIWIVLGYGVLFLHKEYFFKKRKN